jgi:hypothetical protein
MKKKSKQTSKVQKMRENGKKLSFQKCGQGRGENPIQKDLRINLGHGLACNKKSPMATPPLCGHRSR